MGRGDRLQGYVIFLYEYVKTKDARLQTYINDEDNSNILMMVPINIPRSESFFIARLFQLRRTEMELQLHGRIGSAESTSLF